MNTEPNHITTSSRETTEQQVETEVATESPTRYLAIGIVTVLALIALCAGSAWVLGSSLSSRAVIGTPTPVPGSGASIQPTGALAPGSPFSVQGAGFQAGETVQIFIGPAKDAPFDQFTPLGEVQVGNDGTFIKDGLVAPNTPGTQFLVAKGSASGYTQFTQVEVSGQPQPPTPAPGTAVPGGPLPDLSIISVRIELETGNSCAYASNQLGIRVDIQNGGSAAAGPFQVQINDQLTLIETGLAPGQITSRWLPGYSTGSNRVIIDPNNTIIEGNDSNNSFDGPLPVPTLPPPCTPPPVTGQPPPPLGSATPNPDANGVWYGQYFGNQDLSGAVLYDQNYNQLNVNWGGGAPGPGVPRNNWSAIFVRNENFGTTDNYQFNLTVDGGARVYVDNQLVRDEWFNGGLRQVTFSRGISAGTHTIRVEYYKATATARLTLTWKVGYTGWIGRYYNNTNREGQPALKRDDPDINFDWGFGSPAPEINADNFSVDWQRSLNLVGGQYVFRFEVDDGVRLFIDNQLVLDSYNVQGNRTVTATRSMSAGPHAFQVQYVEYTGQAKIRFTYDRIEPPTPTASPTPVPVTVIVVTDTPPPLPPTATPIVPATATPTGFPTLPPPPSPLPTNTPTGAPTLPPPPSPLPTATETATPPAPPSPTPTETPGGPPSATPTNAPLSPATIVFATDPPQ